MVCKVFALESSSSIWYEWILTSGVAWIPYSRKYWRELNLGIEPKIAIARILADLNLAVRYGIAIRIYASRKFWRSFI